MRYPVTLDARHLQGLSRPLLSGVIELIWNAIDADAQAITVTLRDNGLSGVSEVEIVDDGHGIDLATAREAFLTLGRSWKAGGARSKLLGRPLHGKEGRGRFSVFRHGGTAVWDSVSQLGGRASRVRITMRHGDSSIEIEDLGEADGPLGTRVLLRDFGTPPQGLLGGLAHDRLISQFAVPIEDHRLGLTYNRRAVDPREVLEDRYDLKFPDRPDSPLEMTVIPLRRHAEQLGGLDARVALDEVQDRSLPLALGEAQPYATAPSTDAVDVVKLGCEVGFNDALGEPRVLGQLGESTWVKTPDLVDRATLHRDDEPTTGVLDLLGLVDQRLVEPVPGCVVPSLEIDLGEPEIARSELAAHVGDHVGSQPLVLIAQELVGDLSRQRSS